MTTESQTQNILLIEDAEDQCLLMKTILQKQNPGYVIESANSFLEAREKIPAETYDAILIDYYLDHEYTALDLIPIAQPSGSPIIIITADSDRNIFKQCFDAGVKDFLNKPINRIELQVRLNSVLAARSYEKSLLLEIKERKRVEAQLRQEERMKHILLQSVPDMIMRINDRNLVVDFKEDSSGRISLQRETCLNEHLREINLPTPLYTQISQMVSQVRTERESEDCIYEMRTPQGLENYEIRAHPGENREVIVFIRDVTAEEQLQVLESHDLKLNLATNEVYRGGQKIELNRKEMKLIRYLMMHPNRVLSKEMILNSVWGYDFEPEARVVDTLVARLRKKIDHDFDPKFIHTERGVGYAFKTSDWQQKRSGH